MDENDTKQINRLNGQSVFSALARFNYNATESQICDEFIESTGHAQHLVVEEVKRILQSAVNDGFIVKNGNNYTLPNVTHIDDSNCEEEDHEEGARSGCVTPEQQEEEVDGIAGADDDEDSRLVLFSGGRVEVSITCPSNQVINVAGGSYDNDDDNCE